jgi:hypothetical protein
MVREVMGTSSRRKIRPAMALPRAHRLLLPLALSSGRTLRPA